MPSQYSTSTLCVCVCVCASQEQAEITADKVLLLNTYHCSSGSTDSLNHKSSMHIHIISIYMRIVFAKIAFSQFLISLCTFDKYYNMSNRCPHCHNFVKPVLLS